VKWSILILVSLLSFVGYCQNPEIKRTWHWVFSDQNTLDFSSGSAVPGSVIAGEFIESNAAISDLSGDLIFFTNGDSIFDKNGVLLPNGFGILGGKSSYDGALFVPKPQNCSIYYLFTADHANSAGVNGLRYSEIDLTLNGGLGDVTTNKNVLLFAPNSEHLAAVHHANLQDIWVMSVKSGTDDFYAYLVDEAGVSSTPVVTTIGNLSAIEFGFVTSYGLKFSPDGKKMAVAENYSELGFSDTDSLCLYDFDSNSGMISNRMAFAPASDSTIFGYEFSPDGQKLYVHSSGITDVYYQYDISSNDFSTIELSKQIIFQNSSSTYSLIMRMAPDGQILVPAAQGANFISSISQPNINGVGCDFEENIITLVDNIAGESTGLNFIASFFGILPTINCSTGLTIQDAKQSEMKISVIPNPFDDFALIHLSFDYLTAEFELFNAVGQPVRFGQLNGGDFYLDRRDLDSGIYSLVLRKEGNFIIEKIVIH